MLKIWGRTNSINVQKVLWCCGELALKYDRIDAGLQFGVNNTPEFRAINPNGLIPTIDDDGFVLWESHAIVRYLGRKHGGGNVWPSDERTAADADRWMDWFNTTLWPSLRPVFWNLVRTAPEKRDMKAVQENLAKLTDHFVIVDRQLAGREYIAGSNFTMGDIPLGVAAFRWFNMSIERPTLPNVDRWYKRLCQRPAYKQHCMIPLN